MIENNTRNTNVQTYIPINDLYHQHEKYEITVERAKKLFLEKWVILNTLSGKDSGATTICVVEGFRRAKLIDPSVGPLYVVTTNTGLDNIVLHAYMMALHKDMVDYGKAEGLEIISKELMPALSANPFVEYIGRGKLAYTPQTAASGRACAVSWKIKPMEKFIKSIESKYQTKKVLSITGSRKSESLVRASNLRKRNENAEKVTKTGLGFTMPIIMDWSLNDVWSLFAIVDDGEISSYSDRFDLMRKHYSSANAGVCDLFAGNTKNINKSCGNRFGCSLCFMNDIDSSLENQMSIDENTYGFMRPLNDLRKYMLDTLFDYQYRSMVGSKITDGFIKVGCNQYSLPYRQNLLRYVLSIQNESYAHGGPEIQLIDFPELVAIQYHWARSGFEQESGTAFNIWNEICERDEGYYPIPATTHIEKSPLRDYMFFDIETHMKMQSTEGLDDIGLDGKYRHLAMHYRKDGESNRVIKYTESNSFNVITKDALAMLFVTDFYPQLLADGKLVNQCPTVMIKLMLECGLIELSKGAIGRLNDDVKRAQTFKGLSELSGLSIEAVIRSLSVSEEVKDFTVKQRKLNKLKNNTQSSLF
ncbi:MAG: DNA sulfur modification protein DndC [Colwellia sp.]|jgi:DNA sulfur modification protein DndC